LATVDLAGKRDRSMRFVAIIAAAVAVSALLAQAAGFAQPAEADRPSDVKGYGVGFLLGEDIRNALQRDGVGVDPDLVAKGFRDGLGDQEPLVSRTEMEGLLAAVHQEMKARMVKRLLAENPTFRKLHDENLKTSQQFLELFGQQTGVVSTESGLQYKVLRVGTGPQPTSASVVNVNARVTLLDGSVIFDEKEAEVRLDSTIKGAAEILQLMKVGARWQVAFPPDLAHGAGGSYPLIGPNETFVGSVELLSIKGGT
jgi:FKBP-type peptidyl-prolyl cis-trans isomerase